MKYLPRVADKMLQERLEAFGAVLIEGPKWTGKTTTAEQQAKSVIKLQNPDKGNEYGRMLLCCGMLLERQLMKLVAFQDNIS